MPLTIGEEQVTTDEDGVIKELVALQLAIMKKTDPTKRGQHPKHHGCLEAEFIVRGDIPEPYKRGLFKEPKTCKARVRWSNGAAADDTTPDIHGMAIKVLNVRGAQALDGTSREEQDFVLIDSEVFFAPDAKTVLEFMKARVASAAKPAVMEEFGRSHPATMALLATSLKTISSPLATRYWSTVPFRLGDVAVKYTAVPADGNPPAGGAPASADSLRQALVARLTEGNTPAEFELCIIPQTDPTSMPVEDPTVRWTSEPVPVATIRVGPQPFDTPECMKQCEELSFDPWHALAEHRPLGGINRARKVVYIASVELRRSQPPTPAT